MRDSFNREVNYLRISVTDRCDLHCSYCRPQGLAEGEKKKLLSFEEIQRVVVEAISLGIQKVRLTGGEPLMRKDLPRLVGMLSSLPGLDHLGITTNGQLLDSFAPTLKEKGLHSINVSLDTLDPGRYRELTGGGKIEKTLQGIETALTLGFPLKINMVLSAGSDPREREALQDFCDRRKITLQLVRQYSLTEKKSPEEPLYHRPPPCSQCNRIRLLADGRLKPCLHSNQEIELNPCNIREALVQTILEKPWEGSRCTNRNMVEIGG